MISSSDVTANPISAASGLPSSLAVASTQPLAFYGPVASVTVAVGLAVGIKEVHDDIWLVSFMDYDLGYFDLETRVLEPLGNPFGPKVLPM